METFEIITQLMKAGLWKYCLVMFKKAETYDLYYRIYAVIRRKYPDKGRGYLRKAFNDDDVQVLLPKDKFKGVIWDIENLYWVVKEMRRKIWI